jgi:hypothetical protein
MADPAGSAERRVFAAVQRDIKSRLTVYLGGDFG